MPKLFLGNWKMYLSDADALGLAADVAKAATKAKCEIAVAPSFTALSAVGGVLKKKKTGLGAQDVFWEDKGAYTGEISAPMLKALGVRYVILGHSERRQWLYETNDMVARKVAAVQRAGLTPVVCVGETAEEKDRGERDAVVHRQLESALTPAMIDDAHPFVIAYEPRWAIGTGKACEPGDALPVMEMIRSAGGTKGPDAGKNLRVLYGGSVDAANVAGFIGEGGFDGVLVGGASTKPDQVRAMLAAFS